jgi:hypothetical protein
MWWAHSRRIFSLACHENISKYIHSERLVDFAHKKAIFPI